MNVGFWQTRQDEKLSLNSALWMEPSSGLLGYDAVTESSPMALRGSPTLATGPDGLKTVNLDGSSSLYGDADEDTEPLNLINGSFWVAGIFRTSSSNANQTIFSNGGDASNRPGFSIQLNGSTGGIYWKARDGINTNSTASVAATDYTQGEWNTFCFVYNSTNSTVEWWVNGFNDQTSGSGIKPVPALTLPIDPYWHAIPGPDYAVGSQRPNIDSLTFNGDLQVQVGSGLLTHDEIEAMHNHSRSRSYSVVSEYTKTDFVKWAWILRPTRTSFEYSVRCSAALSCKIYNVDADGLSRGTLVATIASASPNAGGFVQGEVTGLTADTEYYCVWLDSDGNESRHESKVKTLPSSLAFNFAVLGCIDVQQSSSAGTKYLALRDKGIRFAHVSGDFGYLHLIDEVHSDVTSVADVSNRDLRHDLWYWRFLFSKLPVAAVGGSDHDLALESDGTSEDPEIAYGQAYYRHRFGGSYLSDSDAIYHSYTPTPGIRFVVIDTRSDRVFVSGTDNTMLSSTQMTWLKGQITAAAAASERLVICSDASWDHPAPGDSQTWYSFTSQRQEIFDHIESESMEDSTFTIVGDIHGAWFDDGVLQGSFDADSNAGVPNFNSGAFQHDFSVAGHNVSDFATPNPSQWGLIEMTVNGLNLDVDFKNYTADTSSQTNSITLS